VKAHLKENPKMADEIENQVREKLGIAKGKKAAKIEEEVKEVTKKAAKA
jgi:hypothetical protein